VFQLDVRAEYLIEYFPGFLLGLSSIGFGLFDADNLMALGTLADEMTGAIHFVFRAKPTHVGQFWFLHAHSFPLAELFGYPIEIRFSRCLVCVVAAAKEDSNKLLQNRHYT
jgi:hypothetical protein